MILQANLNHFNALVIRQYIQTLNNRLVDRYGTIKTIQKVKSFFLVGNEDFIDINSQSNCYFFVTFLIFRHVRQDFSVVTMRAPEINNYNLSEQYTTIAKTIKASVNQRLLFITHYPFLFSFSRQVAITQAEKLVFSFLACASICSIKSWGKRIAFLSDLLFLLPVAIFIPKKYLLVCKHYTRSLNNKKGLTCDHTIKYSEHTPNKFIRLRKTIARSIRSTTSYLTQPLTEVMIMANRYDSAPLRAEQSKLFKFYDLSTTKVLETVANTEREARKNLGKQSLIFIARIRLYPIVERSRNWGGYNHE